MPALRDCVFLSRLSRKREPLMNLVQQKESNRGCWAEKRERGDEEMQIQILELKSPTPGLWIDTGPWVIWYQTAQKA